MIFFEGNKGSTKEKLIENENITLAKIRYSFILAFKFEKVKYLTWKSGVKSDRG
jgi:hypothetical protein